MVSLVELGPCSRTVLAVQAGSGFLPYTCATSWRKALLGLARNPAVMASDVLQIMGVMLISSHGQWEW